jgi:hypothetical protein
MGHLLYNGGAFRKPGRSVANDSCFVNEYPWRFEPKPPGSEGAQGPEANSSTMRDSVRGMPELELALLKRSVGAIAAGCERCDHCHRTPLVGERVYVYESGRMRCELCRALQRDTPSASRVVHGPEFGYALRIRITDQRAA